ncbi:hypothetical protein CFSAN001627_17223, partial [Clostridium botulinum CFSAN001627]
KPGSTEKPGSNEGKKVTTAGKWKLPNTATHAYGILLAGSVLALLGAGGFVFKKRHKHE